MNEATAAVTHASIIPPILIFCGAAVVAVPLAKRIGLGAVIGYLLAGIVMGPSVLAWISEPQTVRGVAEFGVVLLLFLIGLELKISHLLEMRRDIFGLGTLQLLITGSLATLILHMQGLSLRGGLIIGLALSLSATAVALQLLEERNDRQTPYGQRTFAVLLFQDMSIVPILALVPLLAGAAGDESTTLISLASVIAVGKAIAAIAAVVIIGRYGLNPMFRILADTGAREVMTAAALLIVLGSAVLMDMAKMSMAMGAFLAGLMLAESHFRHQLEADIEPFRGILLGLFFMSVGMSIDLDLVRQNALFLITGALGLIVLKILLATVLCRWFGSPWREAARTATLLSPAGEFAFVIIPLTASLALVRQEQGDLYTALAALTMLMGPLVAKIFDKILLTEAEAIVPDATYDSFEDAKGTVLVIGFGRFGQVVNQVLLAKNLDVTVIDRNIERIRGAVRFGLKVYYGDGSRLDVLRAAGADRAKVICICIDDKETTTRIVDMVHSEFPAARTHVRAYDRVHAIDLMNRDVDVHVRETFEAALMFGKLTLKGLGFTPESALSIVDDVRKRDIARLVMQQAQGIMGGVDLLHGRALTPEPLTEPTTKSRALTEETRVILSEQERR